MSTSIRIARLLSAMFVASRVLTATAHAQSATITVASIPNVQAGNPILVSYTVTNTGPSTRTFGIGADIRQGTTVLADLGTKGTSGVAPGATASSTFTFIVPAGWSNSTYTAHAAVWTGTPGSTTLLNTYDRDFSVQAQATAATITVAPIAPVQAGNSITVSYTVTNTGNFSRSFGIGADLRQGTTVLTNLGTKGTSGVAPGATATGVFTYIVPTGWSNGTYTAHAAVWTGTPGSTTLLNTYDRDFFVQPQATAATITVAPISAVLAGDPIIVSYTVTNTGNYTRIFGIGADIRQGTTVLADLGTKGTSGVAPGATASSTFTFIVPAGWSNGTYTAHATVWTGTPGSTTLLNTYDRDFSVQPQATAATITVAPISAVLAGDFITVSYTITNTGNYSRIFDVDAEIRQGTTVLTNLGTKGTSGVAPGGSATGGYIYFVPSGWSNGTYTAHATVWTGTPGSTTLLNTYDRDFTVGPQTFLSNPRLTGTTFRVSSSTQFGFTYVLEFENSAGEGNWTSVQTNVGTGGLVTLTNAGVAGPVRVYRVRVQ